MGTRLASVRTQRIRATLLQRQDGVQTIQITVTPSRGEVLMSLGAWQALLTSISRFASEVPGQIELTVQEPLPGVSQEHQTVTFWRISNGPRTHQDGRKQAPGR